MVPPRRTKVRVRRRGIAFAAWSGQAALAICAGVAAILGKNRVADAAPPVPTEAVASVKKDVAAVKAATDAGAAAGKGGGPERAYKRGSAEDAAFVATLIRRIAMAQPPAVSGRHP